MPLFYIIFIWAISYGLFIFRKQKMRNSTPPTHVINLSDQIYAFEISGSEWTTNLLCIAVTKKIILGIVKFPVSRKFLERKIQFSINLVFFHRKNPKSNNSSGINSKSFTTNPVAMQSHSPPRHHWQFSLKSSLSVQPVPISSFESTAVTYKTATQFNS